MRFLIIPAFVFFNLLQNQIYSQRDSLILLESDSQIEIEDSLDTGFKNPTRALLFSAVLPGLGQAYNNKYWKIPIIYTAIGGVGYSFSFFNRQYNKYLDGLEELLKHEKDTSVILTIFDEDTDKDLVIQLKENYRRNRDLSALAFLAVYGLNIIDATVDAHLSNFDISDDLSLNIKPDIFRSKSINNRNYFCLTFCLTFK
jgi:hypothetical protein